MADIYLIYGWDMPEISLWYAWDKITALWKNDNSLFMRNSQKAYKKKLLTQWLVIRKWRNNCLLA